MDLRWLDDLDPTGAETADAAEELTQDIYHVIEQEKGPGPGSNPDDPTRGLGVGNLLSDTLPAKFTDNAEIELMRGDDRVSAVKATIERMITEPTEQDVLTVLVQPSDDLLEEINLQVPFGTSTTPKA